MCSPRSWPLFLFCLRHGPGRLPSVPHLRLPSVAEVYCCLCGAAGLFQRGALGSRRRAGSARRLRDSLTSTTRRASPTTRDSSRPNDIRFEGCVKGDMLTNEHTKARATAQCNLTDRPTNHDTTDVADRDFGPAAVARASWAMARPSSGIPSHVLPLSSFLTRLFLK